MSTTTSPASPAPLRVLFCIGVLPANFEADAATLRTLFDALKEAFGNLKERFGIDVLGTMDDDKLMVGPSTSFPWTSYILADVPDLDTVAAVTNLLRVTEVDGSRLWRYLRIEARVGRPLFFGNA
jgi:hypothetical protein